MSGKLLTVGCGEPRCNESERVSEQLHSSEASLLLVVFYWFALHGFYKS